MAEALARALPPLAMGVAASARVGPNAVIQLGQALRARLGEEAAREVFDGAGLREMLERPPAGMVEQDTAARLFESLFARLPAAGAAEIAREAGTRTADYVMAHRIPRAARAVLKVLPAALAAPLLIGAIGRHAWTFAGSGTFTASPGPPPGMTRVIEIAGNPLAMPGCAWHLAVFERLFRVLVAPRAAVAHTRCCHAGAPACRFEIDIAPRPPA